MSALVFVSFPIITALALWLFDRHRLSAVVFFGALVTLFPFLADSSDWVTFDWAKRYFILVPCLMLAVVQWLATRRTMPGWTLRVFAGLGFANVLVFVLQDVALGHWGNASFGLAIMVTFPFGFRYDRTGVVGFVDRTWVVAFCICDAIFIHFCPVIENSYYFVMIILPLELVMLMIVRDWHKAFEFRLYSLGPFLLMDSFFDSVSDLAYPVSFTPAYRIDAELQTMSGIVAAALAVLLLAHTALRRASFRK